MGIFGASKVEKLKAKGNVKELIKLLYDPEMCPLAAKALFAIIMDEDEKTTKVKAEAILALRMFGAPIVEPLLTILVDKLAKKEEDKTVVTAFVILREIGEPAVELLLTLAADKKKNKRIRRAAILALEFNGITRALVLFKIIATDENEDEDIRHLAALILNKKPDAK